MIYLKGKHKKFSLKHIQANRECDYVLMLQWKKIQRERERVREREADTEGERQLQKKREERTEIKTNKNTQTKGSDK